MFYIFIFIFIFFYVEMRFFHLYYFLQFFNIPL